MHNLVITYSKGNLTLFCRNRDTLLPSQYKSTVRFCTLPSWERPKASRDTSNTKPQIQQHKAPWLASKHTTPLLHTLQSRMTCQPVSWLGEQQHMPPHPIPDPCSPSPRHSVGQHLRLGFATLVRLGGMYCLQAWAGSCAWPWTNNPRLNLEKHKLPDLHVFNHESLSSAG